MWFEPKWLWPLLPSRWLTDGTAALRHEPRENDLRKILGTRFTEDFVELSCTASQRQWQQDARCDRTGQLRGRHLRNLILFVRADANTGCFLGPLDDVRTDTGGNYSRSLRRGAARGGG